MNHFRQALRLNVGFLVASPVGTSRDFDFDLPRVFFEPDLTLNHLTGTAHLSRTAQGLLAQVQIQATLNTQCARCLNDLEQPLNTDFTELFGFSNRSTSQSDLILPDNAQIDLAPLVREYMLLEIPINPLCRTDCQGLCPVCGEPRADCSHEHAEDSIDPRLSQLKSLLYDNPPNQGDTD